MSWEFFKELRPSLTITLLILLFLITGITGALGLYIKNLDNESIGTSVNLIPTESRNSGDSSADTITSNAQTSNTLHWYQWSFIRLYLGDILLNIAAGSVCIIITVIFVQHAIDKGEEERRRSHLKGFLTNYKTHHKNFYKSISILFRTLEKPDWQTAEPDIINFRITEEQIKKAISNLSSPDFVKSVMEKPSAQKLLKKVIDEIYDSAKHIEVNYSCVQVDENYAQEIEIIASIVKSQIMKDIRFAVMSILNHQQPVGVSFTVLFIKNLIALRTNEGIHMREELNEDQSWSS